MGSRADLNREEALAPLKTDRLHTHEYLVRLAQKSRRQNEWVRRKAANPLISLSNLVRLAGFEPTNPWFVGMATVVENSNRDKHLAHSRCAIVCPVSTV